MSADKAHRSTAMAFKDEYDEVTVGSTEVLEASVVAIRDNLNELKNDFRAAVARIDNDIKTAVMRLQDEIRANSGFRRLLEAEFLPLRLNVFLEALAAWKSPLWLRE